MKCIDELALRQGVRNNKLFSRATLKRESFFSEGFLSWHQWFSFPGAEGPSHSGVCCRNGVFLVVTLPGWGFLCGKLSLSHIRRVLVCMGYLNGIAHHPLLVLFFCPIFFLVRVMALQKPYRS